MVTKFYTMKASEKISEILKIIGLKSDEKKPEEQPDEKPAEIPVVEDAKLSEEPAPEPVAEEPKDDMASKLAALEDRIKAVEDALKGANDMAAEAKAENTQIKTALSKTLELMEQVIAEPSADSAQQPKQTYFSKQIDNDANKAQRLVSLMKTLKNN